MSLLTIYSKEICFEPFQVASGQNSQALDLQANSEALLLTPHQEVVFLTERFALLCDDELVSQRFSEDFDENAPSDFIGHMTNNREHRVVISQRNPMYELKIAFKFDQSLLQVSQKPVSLNGVTIPGWGVTYDGRPFEFVSYEDGETEHFSVTVAKANRRRGRQARVPH